jgi:hypothetical protein
LNQEHLFAICCGSIGQMGTGTCSQWWPSFELTRGRFHRRWGSYLYPFQTLEMLRGRNYNTWFASYEQNDWADGIIGFFLRNDAHARVLEFNNESFRGEHSGYGPKHDRESYWEIIPNHLWHVIRILMNYTSIFLQKLKLFV